MKIAVVYWSGTGNTEAMAKAVKQGAGVGAELFSVSDFDTAKADAYDAFALGCPAMGSEELEDSEFVPMLEGIEAALTAKKVALFGSYDWGVGEWLDNWEARCAEKGIALAAESVKANNAPDDEALDACKKLGAAIS